MANLLNTIITNQNVNTSNNEPASSFTFDTTGKIKPLQDKATLLPSRIFGSPIEYAKDLKQDIVNIGKAAKGQANDHELGRINDLAMKLGSLGIASYLFIKNPLKLSKGMEFIGFGSFFAAMSLWPKLAIQAPLKARTGVDFQQEYIDSQNRKKLLYQDPQYVLTDLLPREDLDNIGKKMGVDENLPDRDNFIKQRAHKTALQANTLWMMTAGVATPVMSALMCNVVEKGLKPAIEKFDNVYTSYECFGSNHKNEIDKSVKAFSKFLDKNAEKPLDEKMLNKIAGEFDTLFEKSHTLELKPLLRDELKRLSAKNLNADSFEEIFGKDVLNKLTDKQKENYINNHKLTNEQKIHKISEVLSKTGVFGELKPNEIRAKLENGLNKPNVSGAKSSIVSLYEILSEFSINKSYLDKYLDVRIGDRSGSYIANQWERFCGKFLSSLKLDNPIENIFKNHKNPITTEELKKISDGDTKLVRQKMEKLVSGGNFKDTVSSLMKMIDNYEKVTTEEIIENIGKYTSEQLNETNKNFKKLNPEKAEPPYPNKAYEIFEGTRNKLATNNFVNLAEKVSQQGNPTKSVQGSVPGTLYNTFVTSAESRILGAKSSFYRLIQALDIFKQSENGTLKTTLTKLLKQEGQSADETTLARLENKCKDIIMRATTVDYVEKFTSKGFGLTEAEYKVVMKALFEENAESVIGDCLKDIDKQDSSRMLNNLKQHRQAFMQDVVNWQNGMRPDIARRIVGAATSGQDGAKRNNLVGKTINDLVVDFAKSNYNSKKWMLIFGGIMTALTAGTLGAGLMLGSKDKTEEQAEEESRKNV